MTMTDAETIGSATTAAATIPEVPVTCPLCEATCGLSVQVHHDDAGVPVGVGRIRGDRKDPFSQGYLCPKGSALGKLHDDPDRLRTPMIRRADGTHASASWEAAYDEIGRRHEAVVAAWGRDAVAIYSGNPTAHNLAYTTHARALVGALGTRQRYSASTVDQMPKQVAVGLLFGTAITVPIPDIDRTDLLVLLGADPVESNGSLLTAPGLPDRLRAIKQRGGRIVVVDPRRSRTAELAGEHLPIRPGADALLLLGIVHTLFEEDLVHLNRAEGLVDGLVEMRAVADRFSPEAVADACAIEAGVIRTLARDLARTPRAAVYGRIGTCTQAYGTLASWLVDVVNILAGNLDVEGGALFTRPLAGAPHTDGQGGRGRGISLGTSSNRTRVRGLPAVFGELPVACLAEEIDTPIGAHDHRSPVRGLFTLAGNPMLSTPNSARLGAALATLDLMVSIDLYLNETSRLAHVVLPAPSPLQRPHFDVLLYRLAIRNTGSFTPPTLPLEPTQQAEWEILLRLGALVAGDGSDIDVAAADAALARGALEAACRPGRALEGVDVAVAEAALEAAGRTGPERILDVLLRSGPWGDRFSPAADPRRPETGISLATMEAHPHGVDLGALTPRLPDVLRTPNGRIDLAPAVLVEDALRLDALLAPINERPLLLVGRRDLRSNNSWMHNVEVLVKGKERCTLHVNPEDARRLGLVDGGAAKVAGRVGAVVAPVRVTAAIRPGVVSLPHGWGHDADGMQTAVASSRPGVNSNVLTDELELDPLSGNAVLSGIPVEVSPA